jgi:hypothetical protein
MDSLTVRDAKRSSVAPLTSVFAISKIRSPVYPKESLFQLCDNYLDLETRDRDAQKREEQQWNAIKDIRRGGVTMGRIPMGIRRLSAAKELSGQTLKAACSTHGVR